MKRLVTFFSKQLLFVSPPQQLECPKCIAESNDSEQFFLKEGYAKWVQLIPFVVDLGRGREGRRYSFAYTFSTVISDKTLFLPWMGGRGREWEGRRYSFAYTFSTVISDKALFLPRMGGRGRGRDIVWLPFFFYRYE